MIAKVQSLIKQSTQGVLNPFYIQTELPPPNATPANTGNDTLTPEPITGANGQGRPPAQDEIVAPEAIK